MEVKVSIFSGCEVEDIALIINKDYRKINDFDFSSLEDRALLVKLIEKYPGLFLQIKPEHHFDDVVVAFLKIAPQMYVRLPKASRTLTVRLKYLERNPEMVEFFDLEDFDYDVVKFLYVNYPNFLEGFDDNKINLKVNSLISKLVNEGVKTNYTEIEEEEDDEDGNN